MPEKSRGSVSARFKVWFSDTSRSAKAPRLAASTSMPPASSARSASRPATTCSDARRLLPASVSTIEPTSNSNTASALRAVALPGASQRRRPAIIRWTTTKSSPSSASTTRLPIRSIASTRLPSTAESGGTTLRSRNGLPMRTRSSRWPTTRAARRSM